MKNESKATVAATKAPNVHNGTYTVDGPKGHFTVKLHTVAEEGAFNGKRILSMLVGPNNETDFKGVAFWDDENQVARVWKRFTDSSSRMRVDAFNWQSVGWSTTQKKLAIWADLIVRGYTFTEEGLSKAERTAAEGCGYWRGEGYTLLLEGRCVVCNHKLTSPASIRAGIGSVCEGKL